MISLSCEIKQNRFPQLHASGRRRAGQAAMRAGYAVQRGAAPFTPVRTGALKANLLVRINDSALSVTVKWGQFYAIFQNEGTRRGIVAKKFAQKGAEAAWPQFRADMANIYGTGV